MASNRPIAYPPRKPAHRPDLNPVSLKCEAGHTFGWAYPDGTVELICTEKICRVPGFDTRHLFNPRTGRAFPVYVERKPVSDSAELAVAKAVNSSTKPRSKAR